MSKRKTVGIPLPSLLFILAMILLLGILGCTGEQLAKAKTARDDAQKTLSATTRAVAELEAELAGLPPDSPGRDKVAAAIAKGKELAVKAQKVIDTASATINSLETGDLDPGLKSALLGVPYGTFIVAGLSVGFGIWRSVRAGQASGALQKVVESWHKVGPELSADDKAKVKEIQGDDVSALVHRIKEQLNE